MNPYVELALGPIALAVLILFLRAIAAAGQKWEPCRMCEGSGERGYRGLSCVNCKGQGRVKVEHER